MHLLPKIGCHLISTYEWTTFIIVDELQHIKGHIDWLYQEGITGGGYQFLPDTSP